MQKFYPSTTVFMALKSNFRPNLLDLENKFDFAHSMPLFWPPTVVHPKSTKLAKNGLFGPFDSQSYKNFFAEAY